MKPGLGTTRAEGRWPSNVVFSHAPDCVPAGTRRVRSNAPAHYVDNGAEATLYRQGMGRREPGEERPGYADVDGTEEVAAWNCAPDCPVRALDEQTGTLWSHGGGLGQHASGSTAAFGGGRVDDSTSYGDSGGASRFFPTFDSRHEDAERRFLYQSKASSAERNAGLDGFDAVEAIRYSEQGQGALPQQTARKVVAQRNIHPTVKSLSLMRWLVRLVTPPGGTCLDPFTGSGTTGCAASLEGFDFIGIEQDPTYAAIADARIAWWSEHPDGMTLVKRLELEKQQATVKDSGQASLFDTPADVPPLG